MDEVKRTERMHDRGTARLVAQQNAARSLLHVCEAAVVLVVACMSPRSLGANKSHYQPTVHDNCSNQLLAATLTLSHSCSGRPHCHISSSDMELATI